MGLIICTMYAEAIADIVRKHSLEYHIYADDTQIYIFFDRDRVGNAVCRLEVGVSEIGAWMKPKMLKMSDNKTTLLCVTRKGFWTMPVSPSVTIGNCCIQPAKQVSNLRNTGTIRRYLTVDAAACLVYTVSYHQVWTRVMLSCMVFPSTRSHDFRDYRTCRPGLSLELRSRPA